MQIKKYRAATTREALEQVKQDLGEEAFVLETKRVRSRGFLGLGSEMQIEISAANPAAESKNAENKNAVIAKVYQPAGRLDLKDTTIAAPQIAEKRNDDEDNIMSALFSRAEASDKAEKVNLSNSKSYERIFGLESPKIETVEISNESPRLVHPKKESPKPILPERFSNAVAAGNPENNSTFVSNRELDVLRAELREIKFSLGAFSNRQRVQFGQVGIDPEVFGEVAESPFYEAYLDLTAAGISTETARKFIEEIIPQYKNGLVKTHQLAHAALVRGLASLVKFEPDVLIQNESPILAVIGATGVGKTTTIAKLAARAALHERRRVELITLDTYRIAAVEQLKTYAEIIGANCHVVRSVFELDAILHRLPGDATVLIDTTGKNPHDLADQFELADYLKGREEIRKCLVIQATTNPLDNLAAMKKFQMYGADCLGLTKLDETTRPGSMVETLIGSPLPLAYLSMGQRVPEDLQTATSKNFAAHILREKNNDSFKTQSL